MILCRGGEQAASGENCRRTLVMHGFRPLSRDNRRDSRKTLFDVLHLFVGTIHKLLIVHRLRVCSPLPSYAASHADWRPSINLLCDFDRYRGTQ
jgi:hypothetical protein